MIFAVKMILIYLLLNAQSLIAVNRYVSLVMIGLNLRNARFVGSSHPSLLKDKISINNKMTIIIKARYL